VDLPKLFEAGWTFKASLGDGQSIVEAPAVVAAPTTVNLLDIASKNRTAKEA
jgi:hypothetical protein